ncbi:VOC family protein [Neobacillus vireti]|uniref:Uncharacterized protein n=1 Tax=Neobacillus vireti LMG 21834 TaxID=1131730 RepID=A0AB94IUV9_9BACI|nr:hypothetical protein [Neobacillus vireti]ETI70758.1 hypothetical protein BAVI_00105 [Neobacillus vireti LMG 21834]
MSDFLESIEYETGTAIQTFNIIEIMEQSEGFEVLLDIDLDSGYGLEGVKLFVSNEDLDAYETNDIQEAVKYALGFFEQPQEVFQLEIEKKSLKDPLKSTESRSQEELALKEKYNIKDDDRAWEDDRL